ncbi:GyrI-like domain-containing protein [Flavivirga sp. 57AJ16]|uniref:SRPBCC family protein n=1 Tax=Flavivirga sp. 57AJ16 TaxID=3025307 RepID=UPI0023673D3E|nr:GyrI-like domain-containing protein [Flavivirga sp. 57AJ16]MDD7884956.1 GyrI-like domain-containing protein [Flavivirga sp. 57AJ16]
MKALKYLLFLLLIITIGTAIYIAVQPNSFEVTRTRTIKAPAAVIYNNVIDFKNWESWSSWAEADPDMKITLGKQTKGVDGSYSWEDKDGVGTMTNIKAEENKSITQEMQFADFPKSDISWHFKPNEDGSTDATWTISGKDLPFGFKAFATFMGGMEKQIAPHYERSLEKLDSIVISDMEKYSIKIDGITQHSGGYYLYNTASCKITELKDKMTEMLPKVGSYAMTNNINMAGAPFVYYHKWDEENNAVMFSTCVPTTTKVISNDSDILTGQLKPFKAIKTTLKGDYENLKEAWETTMKYIPENDLEFTENGPMLEAYLTDPMSHPNPADWVTEIYIAVK